MFAMNFILTLLPDPTSSVSEPLAVLLWGIALVLLSTRRTRSSVSPHETVAAQEPADAPLVARIY